MSNDLSHLHSTLLITGSFPRPRNISGRQARVLVGTPDDGNTMRFEEFAAARLPAVLRFAGVLTGDRALAEDVVQEVLIRASRRWDQIGGLDRPEPVRSGDPGQGLTGRYVG